MKRQGEPSWCRQARATGEACPPRPSPVEGEGVLGIPGLAAEAGLVHGFSTMALGSMRGPAPDGGPLTPARRAFAEVLGLDPGRLTAAGAVHGAEVARVDEPAGVVRGCDAVMTDRPGLPLLATFADCWPVLLYDPVRPAVALVHAGWRGSAAGIAVRAVAAMRREYGSSPADLVAGLGPGICARCYEVGEEVAGRFDAARARPAGDGRFRLDLEAVNRGQLEAAGLRPQRVHVHGACTRETAELASHRRAADSVRFACLVAIR
jgi:purine-nucleoside/S-methyl-5'-thioadenosine phosphorylase / adenosine deaminase